MARTGRQAVRNGGLPAWLLVLIGIVIGGVGVGIIMHLGRMPISRPANGPQPATASSSGHAGPGIAANPQPQKPHYDFYSVLPEKEVVIPNAQLKAKAKAEKQAGQQPATTTGGTAQGNANTSGSTSTASAQAGHGKYMLQVGSFPKASDAEALKARLALQGFVASVHPATIHGKVWNRVRLGPYASASALEAAKKKLAADGIHAIALEVND